MKKLAFALMLLSVAELAGAGVQRAPATQPIVRGCWIRLLPEEAPSAGYFDILNHGDRPVVLTGVETDAFASSMLHETQHNDWGATGVVMVPRVMVPAHGELGFMPGGYHVMLERPRRGLHIGDRLMLSLRFAPDQVVATECAVTGPGWVPPAT